MDMIKDHIRRMMLYAGMSKEEYDDICQDMRRENRGSLMAFSIVAFIVLLVMFLLSLFSEDVAKNRWVYLFIMGVFVVTFLIAKLCKESKPDIILFDIYLFVSALFVLGIVLGTVTRPAEQAVTFIAFLFTMPLLFNDRPIRVIGCILFFMLLFVIVAVNVKADYILAADMIDVSVFGTLSMIISTYMMSVKCQKFAYARKVAVLSETDLLTGLFNRNSYERNLRLYPTTSNKIMSCIYIDVDGLHEMNNTRGHQAGDKMLKFIGRILQNEFGAKNTFRIGGDEFVILLYDETEDAILQKIDSIKRMIRERKYHISCGYARGVCSGMDVAALISGAEKRMYEAKRLYYQTKYSDGRRRTRM